MEDARKYILENEVVKAREKYLSITANNHFHKEKQANALFLYSMILWKKDADIHKSKAALENILKSFPETEAAGDAMFSLAAIEAETQNFKKSFDYLENFVSKFPGHIRVKKAMELLEVSKNSFKTDKIPVRVLLGNLKQCSFSSETFFYIDLVPLNSKKISASLSPENTIKINGIDTLKNNTIISSEDIPINFKSKRYKGKLILNQKNGKIEIINILELGSYLKSVVPSEMPGSWHDEALKAQAVASRTYALFMIKQNQKNSYHLESGILSQVYKGIENICEKSSQAVELTDSEFILLNEKPVLAAFHSNSGGFTEDPVYFWKKNFSYLKQKTDNFSPANEWKAFFSYDQLSNLLFSSPTKINKVYISQTTPSGRVSEITLKTNKGKVSFNGEKFREKTGYYTVKSTLFQITSLSNGIELRGKGFGHGIGMSQWGAKKMAEKGYTYKEIVRYYYSDKIKIEKKLPRSFYNDQGDLFLTKLF